MKRFYILFVLMSCCTIYLQAQFLMKGNSHMLRAGDQHYFNIADNVEPGNEGPAVFWDFGNLNDKSTLISYMYSAYTAPNTTDIPEANAVLEEYGTKFYFSVSEKIIEQYGTVSKNNTITKFDKPFVKMAFPFNYGDSYSGDYSGTIEGPNNYQAKIRGDYMLEADAYGTLILPGNVRFKDVVRIKTTKEYCYNNAPCNYSTISYKWYAQGVRYPLLTIIQSKTSKGIKTIRTAYYSRAQGIVEENKGNNKFISDIIEANIYPNPYVEKFKLDYNLLGNNDVLIEFFDNNGKRVHSVQKQNQKAGFYSETITSEQLGNKLGMYHVRITAGGKTISKTVIRGE